MTLHSDSTHSLVTYLFVIRQLLHSLATRDPFHADRRPKRGIVCGKWEFLFCLYFFSGLCDESLSPLKAQGQSQLTAVHQFPGEPHRCMGALRLPVPNTTSLEARPGPDLLSLTSRPDHDLVVHLPSPIVGIVLFHFVHFMFFQRTYSDIKKAFSPLSSESP